MSAEGRNWAIAIGVNHYDRLPSLKYAERDAQEMAAFWRSIGFEFVRLFDSQQGDRLRQPTRANVIELLGQIAANRKLTAGDNFWFFFSGHGMLDAEGRDYLMPMEASPMSVAETGIRVSYVVEQLRRCGADNVVLLLDACRDEGPSTGAKGAAGVGEDMANQGRLKGVVSIASCSRYESSYELEELQHGAFTYALLEAFRSQRGYATVASLDRYLVDRVPQLVGRDRRQTPHTVVEPIRKSHLILFPHQSEPGDWAELRADAFQAELEGDLQLAEQLWIRINIASAGKLGRQCFEALFRLRGKQQNATPSPIVVPASPKQVEPAPQPPDTFAGWELREWSFETVRVDRAGQIVERLPKTAKSHFVDLGGGVQLELVAVPGGEFQMGSPATELERMDREGPVRTVTVPPLLVSRYPVTVEQWRRVAGSFPAVLNPQLNADPSRWKEAKGPIECVNWFDAMEFCARLSKATNRLYRLPSEAEWEYACRGGTQTPFAFGETLRSDLANYDGNYTYADGPKGEYRERTTPVGQFPPNRFGLQDMHGNVWEWCMDDWYDSYAKALSRAEARFQNDNHSHAFNSAIKVNNYQERFFQELVKVDNQKLLRGGSWDYYPGYCRSAVRFGNSPDNRSNDIGFRVCCAVARTS
ncbi:MAG: peptidase C14 [Limnothrix sp. CACIAM 69d]|nr:MAG: peptidase C14 [Limnothrix sp. CACIAM 69d]